MFYKSDRQKYHICVLWVPVQSKAHRNAHVHDKCSTQTLTEEVKAESEAYMFDSNLLEHIGKNAKAM